MNIETFEQQIQEVYDYADQLYQQGHASQLPAPVVLSGSFEDLRTALEELSVALEELNQQNCELTVTRRDLEAERRRYRELFDHAPDGYLITDTNGLIQEANEMAATLFGTAKHVLVGKPLSVYVAESDRLTFRHRVNRLKSGKVDRFQEWEILLAPRNQQSIAVAMTVSVVYSPQGEPQTLRWILRDIRARKQAEAQLQQIQIENLRLQEANKLKTQFLTVMSHEFRTPLNAIIGFSRLLLRQFHGDSQATMVERIHNNGLHLLSLLSNILDLALIEAGNLQLNLEAINVAEMLQMTAAELRDLAVQKKLSLDLEVQLSNPIAINDCSRFRQILTNLIANAIKFTEAGGVKVTLTETAADELILTVQDSGIGIEPQHREQIFTAFQQVNQTINRKYSGTGLGLAMTRSLVHLMQGEIKVASQPSQGSTFTVKLPRRVRPMGTNVLSSSVLR